MVNPILKGLNPKQKEGVTTTRGPLLIKAGAGSGKTRVLTRRIAYLIKYKHVKPWNILALTFTNKAAKEMKKRIAALLKTNRSGVWASTFHALGISILKRYAHHVHYKRTFTIADPSTPKTIVKHIIKDTLGLDISQYKPSRYLAWISAKKANVVTYKMVQDDLDNDKKQHIEISPELKRLSRVYTLYEKSMIANQNMDFDDLIMLPVILFRVYPNILRHYQECFRYIHVDEYQDTNEAQYEMVNDLAKRYKNICVVGDVDQSIYGWRGANIHNILDFRRDYPQAHVVYMEQNYRSTKTILDAANCVIKNNPHKHRKHLWTHNDKGPNITVYKAADEYDEARYIISKVIDLVKKHHYQLKDIAILYRVNAISRNLENAAVEMNVPYKIVGGLRFYDHKEIKDALAYLSVLSNPDDSPSLLRIINVPHRSIGKSTVKKLNNYAYEHQCSLLNAVFHADDITKLSGTPLKHVKKFAALIEKLRKLAQTANVTDLTKAILYKVGYIPSLKKEKSQIANERIQNLLELTSATSRFDKDHTDSKESPEEELSAFLDKVALLTSQDNNTGNNCLTMMTLHSSKGLEYPVVFIAGMEENIFPSYQALSALEKHHSSLMHEERRLAYVGITRAKCKLYLTSAVYRYLYGYDHYNNTSRFIQEIAPELLSNDSKHRSTHIPSDSGLNMNDFI